MGPVRVILAMEMRRMKMFGEFFFAPVSDTACLPFAFSLLAAFGSRMASRRIRSRLSIATIIRARRRSVGIWGRGFCFRRIIASVASLIACGALVAMRMMGITRGTMLRRAGLRVKCGDGMMETWEGCLAEAQ